MSSVYPSFLGDAIHLTSGWHGGSTFTTDTTHIYTYMHHHTVEILIILLTYQ